MEKAGRRSSERACSAAGSGAPPYQPILRLPNAGEGGQADHFNDMTESKHPE